MTEPLNHKEKGNHKCLSEDWLIDNLPPGWSYDCHMGETFGFVIYPKPGYDQASDDPPLFIPLDLLVKDRNG